MHHKVLIDTFCGSLRFTQVWKGREHTSTEMQVRRVTNPDHGEHVQIGITAHKFGKRHTSMMGSLILSPKEVESLIIALTKLHPPYDPTKYYDHSIEKEREFYGLPEKR